MYECKYCGKGIDDGSYCNDDCGRYHNAQLNNELIKDKESIYNRNEISDDNRKRWS